ncbi:MAG: hypothetical protein VKK04_19490 [Synechococcales bacterium]|nr:hypothetical protein [Synechococcales bacterium]
MHFSQPSGIVLYIMIYLASILVLVSIFVVNLSKGNQSRALKWQDSSLPCFNCKYFTGELLLKCAVHPARAFTEAANNCRDFDPYQRPED